MSSPSAAPRRQSTAHSPAAVPLARYADGSIYALSLSEPGTVYRVTVTPALSCECKGWQYRGHCCHATAAAERFPVCLWCDSTEGVAVYWNGWDSALIALCAACFSPKGGQ